MKTKTPAAGVTKEPVRIRIDVHAAEYQTMLASVKQLRAHLSPKIEVYRLADAADRQRWLNGDALLRSVLDWFDSLSGLAEEARHGDTQP